jgi:fumarate reductase subunit D
MLHCNGKRKSGPGSELPPPNGMFSTTDGIFGLPARNTLRALSLAILLFWHSAHRLRMTLQDLGVRRAGTRRVVALVCYVAAAVGTVLAGWVAFGV